jgi:hypothetical protein
MEPITVFGIICAGLGIAVDRSSSAAQRGVDKGVRNAKKLKREYDDLRESSVDTGDFFGKLFGISEPTQQQKCDAKQHETDEDTEFGGRFKCKHCGAKFTVRT